MIPHTPDKSPNHHGKCTNSHLNGGRNSKIARFTSGHSKIVTFSKVIEI